MENLEERLNAIEENYKAELAKRDQRAAELEKELNDLKAKQNQEEINSLANDLLERITAPDGVVK